MEPTNREQRRHPEQKNRPQDDVPKHPPVDEMLSPDRTPDDLNVRAKSTGHGKKTADKWNQ